MTTKGEPAYSSNGAIFSPCGKYRYSLWREWQTLSPVKKTVVFIMLNPSTADENKLDPTVRRCLGYAMDWGFNRLEIANIFALRATDPRELYRCEDPVGPENDSYIREIAGKSDMVIVAWGNHGGYQQRGDTVIRMLKEICTPNYLKLSKNNTPCHPLYLKSNLKPQVVL